MHLTPTERDRLLLFSAAELARSRRARGLLLNVPEAIAIIADTVAEAARDGQVLADAVAAGRAVLGRHEVLPGVAAVVQRVEVEAVFADGTRLGVVTEPFGPPDVTEDGYQPGAVLPAHPGPSESSASAGPAPVDPVAPAARADLAGAARSGDLRHVSVVNESPIPISVSSHFHFFEVNPRLRFDRSAAWGTRLAIPAGTVQRFEPGHATAVALTPIGGARVVIGFAGLVDGPLDAPGAKEAALDRARSCGYLDAPDGHLDTGMVDQ